LTVRVGPPLEPPVQHAPPDRAAVTLLDSLRPHCARGLVEIGGAAVGEGGVESEFHRVGMALLPAADHALLEWLVADDVPAIRALGFWGLALRGGRRLLLAHFCDRVLVNVCPGGCVCFPETLGEVAQQFALDPVWLGDPLGRPVEGPPLFGADEKRSLEIQLLAVDACRPSEEMRRPILGPISAHWNWRDLNAATPLPAWMLVKAIVRLDATRAGPLLVRVLDDATVPLDGRLAAASGLTRTTAVEADAALARNAAFLDSTLPGLSARLRGEVSMRKKFHNLVAPIEAVHTWMETQKLAGNAIAALALPHALVLDVPAVSYGDRSDEVDRARARALLWLADHLGEYEDCWDQYRDTAYELDRRLATEARFDLGQSRMTRSEVATIEEKVQSEMTRLDSDARCH
jgi:hypothetical protein